MTSDHMPLATREDEVLAAMLADGDQPAFAELYRRHCRIAYSIALRLLRDATLAEDVVQDCFVALWDHPERFRPERGAFRPYLLRVVHSRAVDRLRSETRRVARQERHERERAEVDADIEREVMAVLRGEIVRDAMATLSPGEHDALRLAYFDGLSYREVAAVSGVAEGTVKGHIRAALSKLSDRLRESGAVDDIMDRSDDATTPDTRVTDPGSPR